MLPLPALALRVTTVVSMWLMLVPIEVPAEGTVNQLIVFPVAVAFKFELPPTGQIFVGVAETGDGALGDAVTEIKTLPSKTGGQPFPFKSDNELTE